jgi:hypothetical protein
MHAWPKASRRREDDIFVTRTSLATILTCAGTIVPLSVGAGVLASVVFAGPEVDYVSWQRLIEIWVYGLLILFTVVVLPLVTIYERRYYLVMETFLEDSSPDRPWPQKLRRVLPTRRALLSTRPSLYRAATVAILHGLVAINVGFSRLFRPVREHKRPTMRDKHRGILKY